MSIFKIFDNYFKNRAEKKEQKKKDKKQSDLLFLACKAGDVVLVKAILDAITLSSINLKNKEFNTVLATICNKSRATTEDIEIVKLLVNVKGIDLDDGYPMGNAVYNNNIEFVEILLNAGAKILCPSSDLFVADSLHCAAHYDRGKAIRLILNHLFEKKMYSAKAIRRAKEQAHYCGMFKNWTSWEAIEAFEEYDAKYAKQQLDAKLKTSSIVPDLTSLSYVGEACS